MKLVHNLTRDAALDAARQADDGEPDHPGAARAAPGSPGTAPAGGPRIDVVTAMHAISEGFALFDAGGRLVDCNEAYRRMQGSLAAPMLRPGMRFEDLARFQAEQQNVVTPGRDRDRWIRRRLGAFRSGGRVFEVQCAEGGWHQARDHHCPDGSIMVLCTDITDLKNREHDLEANERRLTDYLESARDWNWETDDAHRFTSISERFTGLTGIPVERFIGVSRREVAPAGASARAWESHRGDLDARRAFRDFVYHLEDDSGARRFFRVSGVPVHDAHGGFRGYRGTTIECTSEMEAARLRDRHLEAIESFSGGYALYDSDDRLLEWNSAWVTFTHPETRAIIRRGVSFEAVVRANVENGFYPEAEGDPEAWIARRIQQHEECGAPFEVPGAGGRWYLMREQRTPEGGVLVTSTDITGLKAREQALRASEERFRGFAETAADWFFETDAELRLQFISPRFEKLTGMAPDDLEGCPFESIIAAGARNDTATRSCMDLMHARQALDGVEVQGQNRSGQEVIHSISAVAITGSDGEFLGYRGTGRDVTQARRLASELAYRATHDELTDLVNRRELEDRLTGIIERSRHGDATHALCFVDLDQFKVVNDTCGHSAGDALLRQLARALETRVRGRDTLARLGGDEFALLLEHCALEQAEAIAGTLRRAIEDHEFTWEGKRFRLSASIGLVPISGHVRDASDALRAADTACYLAKEQGRNRVHVYTRGSSDVARREGEMNWVTRINGALAEDRLTLFAQPIVPSTPGRGTAPGRHVELLLRLTETDGTLVPPGAFLPAAERYGLAASIDRWVVRAAFQFLARHRARIPPASTFSINLSGQSIGDDDFIADLCTGLERHGPLPWGLCFEITETAAIANLERARHFMHTIRSLGCEFALDDFGTGLSSFAYLRDLPVDYLKIDGSFIRDIVSDAVNLSMVRSINDIGHVLGKKTIAEYVSGEAEARLLADIGVDFLQGFGIGRPVPLDTILDSPAAPGTPA